MTCWTSNTFLLRYVRKKFLSINARHFDKYINRLQTKWSFRLVRANILSPSFSPNRISCHLISLKFDTGIENFQRLQLVLSNLSSSFHCKICKVLSYVCFTQSSVSICKNTWRSINGDEESASAFVRQSFHLAELYLTLTDYPASLKQKFRLAADKNTIEARDTTAAKCPALSPLLILQCCRAEDVTLLRLQIFKQQASGNMISR